MKVGPPEPPLLELPLLEPLPLPLLPPLPEPPVVHSVQVGMPMLKMQACSASAAVE
jgi:hypothetical protein